MSSGKYETWSQGLLNKFFGGVTLTFATTIYLASFSVTPSVSSLGTEATGSGYGRISVAVNTTNFPEIDDSTTTITNGVELDFPTATGNWSSSANQTGCGVLDASSSGNLYYFGDYTTAKPVLTGDTPYFPEGAFAIEEL